MMTPVQLDRLFYFLGALREGILSKPEFAELNRILETDPEGRDYYVDYMYLCADLCNLQAATNYNGSMWNAIENHSDENKGSCLDDTPLSLEAFQVLGDYEKKADAIEISKAEQEEAAAAISGKTFEKNSRRISKPLFAMLASAIAALIFLLVYINLYPRTSQEVATLTDSIDAQWTSWLPLSKNVRLTVAQEPIKLQRGIIKLVTDEDVQILIESPAEFRFASASQIVMKQGRLFATVSQTGRGFTVQTANSKVTDMGTEFGILADSQGTTELHVFKGKTIFIGETKNKIKKVCDVLAGQALRLEQSGDDIKKIALNDNAFVRSIDSRANLFWRGQKQINLADVVGGGDGFGAGRANLGINPQTGKFGPTETSDRKANNSYIPVADSTFVDGVFVPNGNTEQIVSSVGHIFQECPVTKGYFYTSIMNTPKQLDEYPLFLNGINYNEPQNPGIYLHSNLGITFDLDAFRGRLHGLKLSRFECIAGISDSAPLGSFNADIWVLVDGQIRYQKTQIKTWGGERITVELQDKDRFLTLVSTDGGDPWVLAETVKGSRSSIGHDWVVFGGPALILE